MTICIKGYSLTLCIDINNATLLASFSE